VRKWYKQYKVKVKIVVDSNSPLTQYHFYDLKTDDLIKL